MGNHPSNSITGYNIPGWWFQIFVNFHPYLGKISNLTNIFQMGWNHQLVFSIAAYLRLVNWYVVWRSKRTLCKTESKPSFLEGPSWFLGCIISSNWISDIGFQQLWADVRRKRCWRDDVPKPAKGKQLQSFILLSVTYPSLCKDSTLFNQCYGKFYITLHGVILSQVVPTKANRCVVLAYVFNYILPSWKLTWLAGKTTMNEDVHSGKLT